MNRGFLILAQNTRETDYVNCAKALALSIRNCMPTESIALITDNTIDDDTRKLFDHIRPLPYGDQDKNSDWKLINDWQVYDASPYEYTIKLEADMYIPKSISHWWDILKDRDLVISTTIRNFQQEISSVRSYRKFIDDNKLPDCYNAITYFKRSQTALEFYKLTKDIFENWDKFKETLQCDIDEPATTDWVYALAAHIMGPENTILPQFTDMSMVHMKKFINPIHTDDWTDTLIYEILPHSMRIQTVPQLYPVHYHKKTFANKILDELQ